MFVKECKQILKVPQYIFDKYEMNSIAYFDIETTGFDREEDVIILISLGWYKENNVFYEKQYYAENLKEEKNILEVFKKDISKFSKWCSYNGIAFDEPFLKNRMNRNNICFESPKYHIDLYRIIRPYYKQLGMERCNLKTVEKYLGIERKDMIDGGKSVELYYKYLKNSDGKLKNKIMLHNYEDVLNLPKIFKVIYEIDSNSKLVRSNSITKKQLRFLSSLLKKNKIKLDIDIDKISKKAASRIIDNILKGSRDVEIFNKIIKNSY